MHFFEELNCSTSNPTEAQVINVLNEMISKINDVQFIGVADIVQLASQAIGKVEANKKEELRLQMGDIKDAVAGLKAKMSAESEIKLRQEFAETLSSQRFISAMQAIIEQGNGTEIEKQGMLEKIEAFTKAQAIYKGFGVLSPKDLVLVIQMIETAIDAVNNFKSVFYHYINPENMELLKALHLRLIEAREPLIECSVDLLDLNKTVLEGKSLIVSQLEESFTYLTEVVPEPSDLNQYQVEQINAIIKKNSKNPKLIALPHNVQSLNDPIPKNPFIDEDSKSTSAPMSLRTYLEHFIYVTLFEQKKENEIRNLQVRQILPFSQPESVKFWKYLIQLPFFATYSLGSWSLKLSSNVGYYFLGYFSQYMPQQPEISKDKTETYSKSLVSYSYDSLKDMMDNVWQRLGYSPDSHRMIETYERKIQPIKKKYQSKKEEADKASLETLVDRKNDFKLSISEPTSLGRVQQISKIDEQEIQKKFKVLHDGVKVLIRTFVLYIHPNNSLLQAYYPARKVDTPPTQTDINKLKQLTINSLTSVSKIAVDINLKRSSKNQDEKNRARVIQASLPTFLAMNEEEGQYAKLVKETLRMCLTYSTKFIHPASQRIKAIDWLYDTIMVLTNNDALGEEDKINLLALVLIDIKQRAVRDHLKISFFGQCGFTHSSLAHKIDDLLHKFPSSDICNMSFGLMGGSGIKKYADFMNDAVVDLSDTHSRDPV